MEILVLVSAIIGTLNGIGMIVFALYHKEGEPMFFRKAKKLEELEGIITQLNMKIAELESDVMSQESQIQVDNKQMASYLKKLCVLESYCKRYMLAVKRGKKLRTELNQANNALTHYRKILSDLGAKIAYQGLRIEGVLKK